MSDIKLPRLGLGTWELNRDITKDIVLKAIEMGYRFIDTAQGYGNETEVGEAIKASPVSREKLIIATKVYVFNLGYKKVLKSTEESLRKLGTDSIDLLYVHWPIMTYKPSKTLKAFSELVNQEKIKHVCVSNFTIKQIEEAKQVCDKSIFANQVEHHPHLHQVKLREYLKEKGIYLVAYSPLARGHMNEIPEIVEIAKKHETSTARVSLAWLMEHGAIPIPKSSSVEHLRDNFESLNLKLDEEDIQKIDSIKETKRYLNPPLVHPKWD
jgi:2,5-diketo-D-gluconate reductase B